VRPSGCQSLHVAGSACDLSPSFLQSLPVGRQLYIPVLQPEWGVHVSGLHRAAS
jgi:hypothetical protein